MDDFLWWSARLLCKGIDVRYVSRSWHKATLLVGYLGVLALAFTAIAIFSGFGWYTFLFVVPAFLTLLLCRTLWQFTRTDAEIEELKARIKSLEKRESA